MHYQAPLFETQDVTVAAVRDGSASEVCQAVIGASLAADDAAWVETLCLDLARTHGDLRVQAAAILGLAHLARRFGHLNDQAAVTAVLIELDKAPEFAGRVGDVRDDLAMLLNT